MKDLYIFIILCLYYKYGIIYMDRLKNFRKIMEKSETDKIVLLTNHYKITGFVYDCEECNKDEFVNLTDVTICNLDANYSSDSLTCDEYSSSYFEWLHINLDKVVAFSFIKN